MHFAQFYEFILREIDYRKNYFYFTGLIMPHMKLDGNKYRKKLI